VIERPGQDPACLHAAGHFEAERMTQPLERFFDRRHRRRLRNCRPAEQQHLDPERSGGASLA